MKVCLYILIPFFLLSGCAASRISVADLEGTYAQVAKAGNKFGIDLILNKGTFVFIDHHDYRKNEYDPYLCCDTIAYGIWGFDQKHNTITFDTPDYSYNVISSNIKEEIDSTKQDSIVFMIMNPIEKRMYKKHEDIKYNVSLFTSNPYDLSILSSVGSDISKVKALKFKSNLGDSVSDIVYNTNRIVIGNSNHSQVMSFWINISVDSWYAGRNIGLNKMRTDQYKVLNQKSNIFKIDMPDLTYGFITYLRFDGDLAKVINRNTLEWHGLKYVRVK
jgi:hypothetical protein